MIVSRLLFVYLNIYRDRINLEPGLVCVEEDLTRYSSLNENPIMITCYLMKLYR